MTNIAMENDPFIDGLPIFNNGFSIAMFNNQMVSDRKIQTAAMIAGNFPRFGSSRAEDILMLSALNDVNLPKFTSNVP